jgi:type VI secretion system secreted protein VgrG
LGFKIDQAERFLALEIDGELSDKMIPLAFEGRESTSELYRYQVHAVSDDLGLSARAVLGHPAAVLVRQAGSVRRFTGVVGKFSPGPLWGRGYRSYQLEVVPKLCFAGLNSKCRSFSSQSALDIVHKVLSEYGITESLRGPGGVTRPVRDYCLQYRESDFAFIARLLEEEGLFFYFPPDHNNDKIVIVDGLSGSFEVDSTELAIGPHSAIEAWTHEVSTVPQSVTYSGYDFVQAAVVTNTVTAANKLDYVSGVAVEGYPSNVMDEPRSQFFADMQMQALEAGHEKFTGTGSHAKFAPAGQINVVDPDGSKQSKSYMLTWVEHRAQCATNVSTEGGEATYGNAFGCVPLDTKYRPLARTRRELIIGPQTATVSSDPDEYGRVKVKFHWGQEVESWWARVAMPWAHKQMGFQFFPRIDSEVVVEFLEGVPERPIIVGAVFNGVNMPIYAVPDNKTQSGIRGTDPDSTGSPENFNELQFEDKSGSEFIKIFAQKDFKRVVVNDDDLEVRQGKRTIAVKQGDLTTTLDQGNSTLAVKMGNHTVKIDLGKSSTEAMQSIELKVGQSSVKIDQMGVKIAGMQVQIEGQLMTTVKAPMTDVQGQGMLTLKGGVTMIG